MDTFNRTNLQNIKNIFAEKTNVDLPARRRNGHPLRMAMIVTAVLACVLTVTAYAVSQFSSLSGDDLALAATYEGNGIVLIQVENRSDKELNFQSALKLLRWSTAEEVQPISTDVAFSGTKFAPHTSGVMTVNLSKAYDMDTLEQPLTDDWYYFVLTNNNFIFGQDWMCSVDFAEPIYTPAEEPVPITPSEADGALVAEIIEELRPYFEGYTVDVYERRKQSDEYLSLCQQLLETVDGNIVPSVSPMELTLRMPEEEIVFDSTVPLDMQLQLTSLNRGTLDGYGKIIGANDTESALIFGAYIPQHKGEIDGGAGIPLLYIFTYEVSAIQSSQDYAFIRGQLLTFEEMEQYKIYEDGQYVCYNVSDLFYSDLRGYVESMVSQRSDVYFDEQVWERVQNIYNYFNENLGTMICYRDTENAE